MIPLLLRYVLTWTAVVLSSARHQQRSLLPALDDVFRSQAVLKNLPSRRISPSFNEYLSVDIQWPRNEENSEVNRDDPRRDFKPVEEQPPVQPPRTGRLPRHHHLAQKKDFWKELPHLQASLEHSQILDSETKESAIGSNSPQGLLQYPSTDQQRFLAADQGLGDSHQPSQKADIHGTECPNRHNILLYSLSSPSPDPSEEYSWPRHIASRLSLKRSSRPFRRPQKKALTLLRLLPPNLFGNSAGDQFGGVRGKQTVRKLRFGRR